MRINPVMKPKEPTYQVVLDALALTTCYHAFIITTNILVIYMHQLWATINKHNASHRFKIDSKRFFVNVEVFKEILNICPKILGQEFDEPPSEEETLSFIRELGHSREIEYITDEDLAYYIDNKDSIKQDKIYYPRFKKAIIDHFLTKDKSVSMRNKTHENTQVYSVFLPKEMTNQAMLDSDSYKTYYAIATGAKPPKPKKTQKKSDSTISSEEAPFKKKPAKAKKDVPLKKKRATKPKPTKKKALVKADRGKGLNVLSEVALSEAAQLKEAIKQSKKYSHISHASGSGDGTDFESGAPDEQQRKISGTDEGIGTKLGVPDVPKYDCETEKESWGTSREKEDNDDDEDESEYESDDDKGNDDDGDNDDNDDDCDHERTEEEALADKREYIDLIDTLVRAIIKEEVKTQLPQILPQAVSNFVTLVIERNVTESIEAIVLAKYSSQPKSTYVAAALLSEFELTKILMDKMEEHKSYLRVEYKKELYDALAKSYNIDKDLFESYGEVFSLKRSREDKDKDQDPSAGSSQGTKRRKSGKEAESSRDPDQRKNQEFDTGNNDEQPNDKAASKVNWFKKSERPLTPDPDWNKRQHIDF
nr:hypothetical protein [Tanacetum cinerariifolium]